MATFNVNALGIVAGAVLSIAALGEGASVALPVQPLSPQSGTLTHLGAGYGKQVCQLGTHGFAGIPVPSYPVFNGAISALESGGGPYVTALGLSDGPKRTISTVPGVCLGADGVLTYTLAIGEGDRKLYLNAGQLYARQVAISGDKLVTLGTGALFAT